MDELKAALDEAIGSAAQVAFGAVLDKLTELDGGSYVGPDAKAQEDAYRDAINDVGRAVAHLMAEVAYRYSREANPDEVKA